MAKSKNTKALLGLLGEGLAAKALTAQSLEPLPSEKKEAYQKALNKLGLSGAGNFFGVPDSEIANRAASMRTSPDSSSLVLSGDGTPVRAGDGFLRSQQFKKGGKVSASKRGDGIAQRGKTRGRMV